MLKGMGLKLYLMALKEMRKMELFIIGKITPYRFLENTPPHMCENLTCKGIEFSYHYILKINKK